MGCYSFSLIHHIIVHENMRKWINTIFLEREYYILLISLTTIWVACDEIFVYGLHTPYGSIA